MTYNERYVDGMRRRIKLRIWVRLCMCFRGAYLLLCACVCYIRIVVVSHMHDDDGIS